MSRVSGAVADLGVLDTGERRSLAQTARAFTQRHVVPHLQEWEDAGEVPRSLHREAASAGLLGVAFPESMGGGGGDLVDSLVVSEAMLGAGASSGLLAALFTHGIALPHVAAHGSAELVEAFVRPTLAGETIGALAITEPDGGSDVGRLRTRAVRDGDDLVLNGTKTFITSGARADFVTAAVRTGGAGSRGLSLVVVETDRPGLTVVRRLRKMGWHCSDTAELSFDGVRVPASHVVGEVDGGFAQIAEQFVVERVALAVHAYGLAWRVLALTADHVRHRETFGKPLVARQVVRHRLVEMHRQVEVARTYTREVARRHAVGEDVVAEACLAKNTAVAACEEVVDGCVQLHGGTGYLQGDDGVAEVERAYRDARILGIGGGATEVLTDLAATLLGYAS